MSLGGSRLSSIAGSLNTPSKMRIWGSLTSNYSNNDDTCWNNQLRYLSSLIKIGGYNFATFMHLLLNGYSLAPF